MRWGIATLLVLACYTQVYGCIWDSDSLRDERRKNPDMAAVILRRDAGKTDIKALRKRIEALKTARRETDAAWWNDLAGAYLRLGEAQEAVSLLEPLLRQFPDDYGIHANLGTGYHLLGRYKDAEREIARDLEINPKAHFGLEVYHLALLQYLSREQDYQSRHVYVDEFTPTLLRRGIFGVTPDFGLAQRTAVSLPGETDRIKQELMSAGTNDVEFTRALILELASLDPPPAYRFQRNLATNLYFHRGLRYMAELNPAQPACFVMLGIACLQNQDLNLAASAFERAIALRSPQTELLKLKIAEIKSHISEARQHGSSGTKYIVLLLGIAGVLFLVFELRPLWRRGPGQSMPSSGS